MTIAAMTKYAKAYAAGPYGYSQGSGTKDGRWSGLAGAPGNFDCSSFSGAVAYMGGMIDRAVLKGTFYTGNIVSKLVATGMFTSINVSKLTLAQLKAKAKEGDFLRGPGHVVYCLGNGKCVSFETDERGKSSGGKVGDQTGKEGRVRDIYARSRGWTHLVRPVSPSRLLAGVLAALANGKAVDSRLVSLIQRRSPWDGPRWLEFAKLVQVKSKGMELVFDPKALSAELPDERHVFVVLGSGLSLTGKITAKFKRRLQLALEAYRLYPGATILVSGGAPMAGIAEAEAGFNWLFSQGVPAAKIIVEARSSSTIGNAKYSVPLIERFRAATLISDASHLRRATIEFAAAQAARDVQFNEKRGPVWTTPLAFNDYGTGTIKPTKAIDATSRMTILTEVAALLGVTTQFKAALK